MTAIQLGLAILAVYRVAYMIAKEDGPFDALAWIRGKIDPMQHTWIGRGLNCVLCLSWWLSLVVFALGGSWLEWLAVAGGVLVIHKALYK